MTSFKKKTSYPYNDKVILDYEEGDIHFRIITNERGMYVDIRKYFNARPTKRGVRMSIDCFDKMNKAYMESEHDSMEINEETEKEINEKKNAEKQTKKIKKK